VPVAAVRAMTEVAISQVLAEQEDGSVQTDGAS
jgi:hypothetical protein